MASKRFRYREIVLDSADYNYGDKNSPIFQFDYDIDNSNYFQIHRLIIPTSYYVFDSSRTAITVNGVPYTWPAGNYTAAEWCSLLTSTLPTITVTYSESTGKLTFKNTGAPGSQFPITFTNTQHAYDVLGFDQNVIYLSALVGGVHTIEAPYVANFSGPNYMYLRSDIAGVFNGNEIYFSNTNVTVTGGDILAMIPIDQNRNSVVHYIDHTPYLFQWNSQGNKKLSFYFTLGKRIDPVDFNGESFQMRITGYSDGNDYHFKQNM